MSCTATITTDTVQTQAAIGAQEVLVKGLEDTLAARQLPLMLASTRLEKRSARPNIELVRDSVHSTLLGEVATLQLTQGGAAMMSYASDDVQSNWQHSWTGRRRRCGHWCVQRAPCSTTLPARPPRPTLVCDRPHTRRAHNSRQQVHAAPPAVQVPRAVAAMQCNAKSDEEPRIDEEDQNQQQCQQRRVFPKHHLPVKRLAVLCRFSAPRITHHVP